jgi:hypothetical protein
MFNFNCLYTFNKIFRWAWELHYYPIVYKVYKVYLVSNWIKLRAGKQGGVKMVWIHSSPRGLQDGWIRIDLNRHKRLWIY